MKAEIWNWKLKYWSLTVTVKQQCWPMHNRYLMSDSGQLEFSMGCYCNIFKYGYCAYPGTYLILGQHYSIKSWLRKIYCCGPVQARIRQVHLIRILSGKNQINQLGQETKTKLAATAHTMTMAVRTVQFTIKHHGKQVFTPTETRKQ